MVLVVTVGQASVYAGAPDRSHRLLGSLAAGQSLVVSGLAADEVVSVQNDGGSFSYTFTINAEPTPPTSSTTTTSEPASTTTSTSAGHFNERGDDDDDSPTTSEPTTSTSEPTTSTSEPAPTSTVPADLSSVAVVWSCTGSPCPWGTSLRGNAAVWPAQWSPGSSRLGYTTSAPVYLPAAAANGMVLVVTVGQASVYAGAPDRSHRLLGSLAAGQSLVVSGLAADEVVSVQNDGGSFSYTFTINAEPTPPTSSTTTTTTTTVPVPPTCTDPLTCDVVTSIRARWRCNIEGCTWADWVGGVINWPSWAAYESNGRSNDASRTVYSESGELLYPYMGSWAHGCTVTAVFEYVLIIEWERGTNGWRSTYLSPGQSHTISLTSPEDGALIETPDTPTTFGVRLTNCTPQPVDKS